MSKLSATLQKQLIQSIAKTRVTDLAAQHVFDAATVSRDLQHCLTFFNNQGLQTGDYLMLGLPNSYQFYITYLAALITGLTITAVDPQIPNNEAHQLLAKQTYAAVIFAEDTHFSTPEPHLRLSINPELATSHYWQRQSINHHQPTNCVPTENSLAIYMYTSGTTGTPKAVGLTHAQLLAAIQNIIAGHQLTAADRTYLCLPLFHINAQVISLLATTVSGGQLVIAPKFSASQFWATVQTAQITWVSLAPTIINILLKKAPQYAINHHLRFIRSASAPLAITTARQFEKTFQVPLIESYGMTEAASQICANPLQHRKLGSVGVPIGLDLKIVAADHSTLPANQMGEIAIRGANVITAYQNSLGNTDFDQGWVITGDLGYQDSEGYVFINGRQKDVINRGGEKLSPTEVENILLALPFVEQVCVTGQPDPILGERVSAYIILTNHSTDAQQLEAYHQAIIEHCQHNLSRFKQPEIIHFVQALPSGPTGKVKRHQLTDFNLQEVAHYG